MGEQSAGAPRAARALAAALLAVAMGAAAPATRPVPRGAATHPASPGGLIGTALSGVGTRLKPPGRPSYQPYSADCHRLVDPAFRGRCVTASGPGGTVAAVVEQESGASGTQERDLVWRKEGRDWALALVHVAQGPPAPALAWRDEVAPSQGPDLVLVVPSARRGYASELDLVDRSGRVVLYRFLGGGFATAPVPGRLVTYVPSWAGPRPRHASYSQVLIGFAAAHWRVFSIQSVPYAAAQARYRGAFSGPGAVPAS